MSISQQRAIEKWLIQYLTSLSFAHRRKHWSYQISFQQTVEEINSSCIRGAGLNSVNDPPSSPRRKTGSVSSSPSSRNFWRRLQIDLTFGKKCFNNDNGANFHSSGELSLLGVWQSELCRHHFTSFTERGCLDKHLEGWPAWTIFLRRNSNYLDICNCFLKPLENSGQWLRFCISGSLPYIFHFPFTFCLSVGRIAPAKIEGQEI